MTLDRSWVLDSSSWVDCTRFLPSKTFSHFVDNKLNWDCLEPPQFWWERQGEEVTQDKETSQKFHARVQHSSSWFPNECCVQKYPVNYICLTEKFPHPQQRMTALFCIFDQYELLTVSSQRLSSFFFFNPIPTLKDNQGAKC